MSTPLLSAEFSRAVPRNFFRPLAGESRGLIIDLLAQLAEGFTQHRRSIPRSEAVDLIREALLNHPDFNGTPAPEAETDWSEPTFRANYYFNQFVEAGWVLEDEFRHSVRKRTVVLDSNAQALLALLRDLAGTSFQTTSRFSDTFRSVIDSILAPSRAAFGPEEEKPYATLRDMIDRCAKGMLVLRRIETLLRRFTHEQAQTLSRRRNLELVVVELSNLTRTQYYRELSNPLLFQRSDLAAHKLEELTFDSDLVRRMSAECVEREEAKDLAAGELLVLDLLRGLADTLNSLRGEASQIESWATRFLSASLAKFRHLQSIPSRQLEAAKEQLAVIAQELAGKKWWIHFLENRGPVPRLPEFSFAWGASSLWRESENSADVAPTPVRRPSRNAYAEAIHRLQEARRKAINQERACAFVARTLAKPGDKVSSDDLQIRNVETLIDVLSCLCYAQARRVNFRLLPPLKRPNVRYAAAGDWFLERFTLERTR